MSDGRSATKFGIEQIRFKSRFLMGIAYHSHAVNSKKGQKHTISTKFSSQNYAHPT